MLEWQISGRTSGWPCKFFRWDVWIFQFVLNLIVYSHVKFGSRSLTGSRIRSLDFCFFWSTRNQLKWFNYNTNAFVWCPPIRWILVTSIYISVIFVYLWERSLINFNIYFLFICCLWLFICFPMGICVSHYDVLCLVNSDSVIFGISICGFVYLYIWLLCFQLVSNSTIGSSVFQIRVFGLDVNKNKK